MAARARLLHPELARHERLADLSHCHRLLFALLPTIADREGRLEDRPRRIQADLFPYDPPGSVDVDGMLTDLEGAGFLVRYEAGGKKCIELPGFSRWQKPHPREKPSELPSGKPKADPRPTQGKPKPAAGVPRRPVSDPVPVSVSDPVPDPVPTEKSSSGDRPPPPAPRLIPAGATVATRKAYLEAYERRWHALPCSPNGNATINGILARVVKALGEEEAPHVAAYFLSSNEALYVRQKHPPELLLRDIGKLRAEWSGAPKTNGVQARLIEKTEANVSGWDALRRTNAVE